MHLADASTFNYLRNLILFVMKFRRNFMTSAHPL